MFEVDAERSHSLQNRAMNNQSRLKISAQEQRSYRLLIFVCRGTEENGGICGVIGSLVDTLTECKKLQRHRLYFGVGVPLKAIKPPVIVEDRWLACPG